MTSVEPVRRSTEKENNRLLPGDRAGHQWYRFVLSFPPHLVRDYAERFGLNSSDLVLDPFCGTGTTLVECKKLGIPAVGLEAHPMAHFASQIKTDWSPDPDCLERHAQLVAQSTLVELKRTGIEDDPSSNGRRAPSAGLRTLSESATKLILKNCISDLPLHKTLVLLDQLAALRDERFVGHERLALAKTVVFSASNLHFGPEVGIQAPKADASVVGSWLKEVSSVAEDLRQLGPLSQTDTHVFLADARRPLDKLKPNSISAVFTSPPYPNEKDYTRTTRLESVLLGFVQDKTQLRALKATLIRSNTRGVYKADDDDKWIEAFPEIHRIAAAIEARRIELGKTSGFERLYARVTKLYFGGMWRHLKDLRSVLRPGALLGYVVGDQASYLRVMIRTGQLLAEIGTSLGYELVGTDLFRTRLATATREQLREEVVVFRWPG